MSGLRNLLGARGGGEPPAPEATGPATEYKGFSIHPAPRREASGWLTAGRITKAVPDGTKEHQFVRADTYRDHGEAVAFCIQKAKQIIDERGDNMFDQG
jgi:hypothetical protein